MKEFQQLKTVHLSFLLSVFLLTGVLGGFFIGQHLTHQDIKKATKQTEKLASQLLWSRNPSALNPEKPTELDLDGRIGKDPWGRPFYYRFLEDQKSSQNFLVVWSSGPNKEKETSEKRIRSMVGAEDNSLFSGDDLGSVKLVTAENQR